MKVICICNRNGRNFLTLGKIYEAKESETSSLPMYVIRNDQGFETSYHRKDFVPCSNMANPDDFLDELESVGIHLTIQTSGVASLTRSQVLERLRVNQLGEVLDKLAEELGTLNQAGDALRKQLRENDQKREELVMRIGDLKSLCLPC